MNEVWPSRRIAKPNAPFLFGTVHAVLPESSPTASMIAHMRQQIAEDDLAGRGFDTGPTHVTLRYGVRGDDISSIEQLLAAHPPIRAMLGATASFSPSAASPDAAVLFAGIACPELHVLYERLGEIIDFAEAAHSYEPHITIAYVRPQAARKYVGNLMTAGHRFDIQEVIIRTESKEETVVTLAG